MVNFKPGEYIWQLFFSICDKGSPEERWVEYGDVFFQPAPSIVQFRVRYDLWIKELKRRIFYSLSLHLK